jgi:hypothetical protein
MVFTAFTLYDWNWGGNRFFLYFSPLSSVGENTASIDGELSRWACDVHEESNCFGPSFSTRIVSGTVTPVAGIPEPSSLTLTGLSILLLTATRVAAGAKPRKARFH